jgi:uncharacterized MAPEG superfamily protein
MTTAYWCVLAAMFLPVILAGFAKAGAKGYDNARPREFLGGLQGWPARANWAQNNCYESFPPFAAGVIIAHATGNADQSTIDALAVTYLLARVAYSALYMLDRSTWRSLVWLLGFASTAGLFVAAA